MEYEEGATAVDEETGTPIVYQGGEWVEAEQPSAVNLQGGGRGRVPWLEDSPEMTERLNTAEPADAFAAGVLSGPLAGSSVALGAGLGALTGMIAVPEGERGTAALVGAAMGGPVGKAIGAGIGIVADPIASALGKATAAVKGATLADAGAAALDTYGAVAPAWAGSAAAGRQASRIKNKQLLELAQTGGRAPGAGAMAATPLRVNPTLATSDELAEKLGMDVAQMTPAQRAMLDQTQDTYDELADPIADALRAESESVFAGNAGADVKGAWDTVQRNFSRKITDDAGLNSRQGITLSSVSERRKDVGQQIGQMLDDKFPSSTVQLNPDYSLQLAVKGGSAGDESKEAAKILEKWGLLKDGEDVLDAPLRNVQGAKRELDKLSEVANKPGVTQNADEIIRRLDNNLIDGMDEVDRGYYSKLKYQYRILSKLREPGVVDDFGKINPKSFTKQWLKGESPNSRHLNEFARLADSVNQITPRSTAGTTGARTIAGETGGALADLAKGALGGR